MAFQPCGHFWTKNGDRSAVLLRNSRTLQLTTLTKFHANIAYCKRVKDFLNGGTKLGFKAWIYILGHIPKLNCVDNMSRGNIFEKKISRWQIKSIKNLLSFEKFLLWLCCDNSFDTLLLLFGFQQQQSITFLQILFRVTAC